MSAWGKRVERDTWEFVLTCAARPRIRCRIPWAAARVEVVAVDTRSANGADWPRVVEREVLARFPRNAFCAVAGAVVMGWCRFPGRRNSGIEFVKIGFSNLKVA